MITKTQIAEKVSSKRQWAERALVVLYERQTEDEQESKATLHHNGRGFNGLDATLLSSFAEQVIEGRRLTKKQLFYAFKRLPKYSRQLYQVAIEKVTIMHCACGQPIVADGTEYKCLGCGYVAPRDKAA